MPTAFTNLFKQATSIVPEKKIINEESKTGRKKRKRGEESDEDYQDGSAKASKKKKKERSEKDKKKSEDKCKPMPSEVEGGSLNLSSTSLILFDEVGKEKVYFGICFYAPAIKWPGHIVLPLSVIPSFRIQFPLII